MTRFHRRRLASMSARFVSAITMIALFNVGAATVVGAQDATPSDSGNENRAATDSAAGNRASTQAGRFIAVGDSIMLGAKAELERRLGFLGWPSVLDMEVSRSTIAGAEALAGHAPGPGDIVVISLGANDSGNADAFRERVNRVLFAASLASKVYWLTIPEVRPYYPTTNAILREAQAATPNMALIDWAAVTPATPGMTARDGLHLTPLGSRTMADAIVGAVLGGAATTDSPGQNDPGGSATSTTEIGPQGGEADGVPSNSTDTTSEPDSTGSPEPDQTTVAGLSGSDGGAADRVADHPKESGPSGVVVAVAALGALVVVVVGGAITRCTRRRSDGSGTPSTTAGP